jgi:hypothetical protein
VIVAGDLDPAGGEVGDRLVDAAVPETQLVGAEAERPAEHWLPRQMPNTGVPAASTPRMASTA